MDDETSKLFVRQFLEVAGYEVVDIPVAKGCRSADLLATCRDGVRPPLIVEAKEKEPGRELARRRTETLKAGKLHELHAVLAEQPVLTRIIDDAVEQLRSSRIEHPDALGFVFVICTGFNAESRFEQFRHRIAGIATIADWGTTRPLQECAFFRHSDFYKHRGVLDGVILAKVFADTTSFQAGLYANCYSPRYSLLRDCLQLQQSLGKGFVDIAEQAEAGDYWSLHDIDGDRSNEAQMLNAARDKYGLSDKVTTLEMGLVA